MTLYSTQKEARNRNSYREAATTFDRYQESGGIEGEIARQRSQLEYARQQAISEAAARQARNSELIGVDYDKRIRDLEITQQARRLRESELAETAIRETRLREAERLREYRANGGFEGERAREVAQAQARRQLEKDAAEAAQRRQAELSTQWAKEAQESNLLADARRLRRLELEETLARESRARVAAGDAARRIADQNKREVIDLFDRTARRNQIIKDNFDYLVKKKALEMGYSVPDWQTRSPKLELPKQPIRIPTEYSGNPRRNGVESFGKEPFTSRPKPTLDIAPKPQLNLRPETSSRFKPLEFAEPPVKTKLGLNLKPIPKDLQDGLINKTKALLPDRPVFPLIPKTNFPRFVPRVKIPIGNVAVDLAFDLFFPNGLGDNQENEILRRIALEKDLERVARSHRDRNGQREPFDYSNPDFRPLDDWDLDDPRRSPNQDVQFDFAVNVKWDDSENLKSNSDGHGGWIVNLQWSMGPIYRIAIKNETYPNGAWKWVKGSGAPKWNDVPHPDGSTWHQEFESPSTVMRIGFNGDGYPYRFSGGLSVAPASNHTPNPFPNSTPDFDPDLTPKFNLQLPPGDQPTGVPNNTPGLQIRYPPTPRREFDAPKLPQWRLNPDPDTNPPWKEWDDPTRPTSVPIRKTQRQLIPLLPYQRFPQTQTQTQTQTQHEKECKEGDCMTCRFDPGIIKRIVQEESEKLRKEFETEININVYDDEKGKAEKKTLKALTTTATKDGVSTIYNEIAKLREEKPIATVPDRYMTRVPDNRPQMVIVYADAKRKSYYELCIPWAQNKKPSVAKWQKGSKMVILTLTDNSKIVVNAKSEVEGNRVINQLKGIIDPIKVKGSIISTSCRKDKLKEVEIDPIRADWYEKGLASSPVPTKRYYFVKPADPPTGGGSGTTNP